MKASIYFDSRKTIKSGDNKGRSHIKILVEFDGDSRTRRYYQTGVFATKAEFKKIMFGQYGKSPVIEADELEKKRKELLALERRAKDVLLAGMTPEEFEPVFRSKGNTDNPLDMLLATSEQLRRDGDIGNSIFYKSAYSGFKKFVDDKHNGRLSFVQVTPRFLRSYEKWMTEKGRSLATVGTHVRPMRTMFLKKIAAGEIPATLYPFGKHKYKCPSVRARKIALSLADAKKVLDYKGKYQMWVDLWRFSYYCNGMNFNDIAQLRRRHINNGILTYDRTKTKHTDRNSTPIQLVMRKEAVQIMNKWGVKDISPDAFIFPVLRDGMTAVHQKYVIADWIKEVNENLEKASAEMKIPKITTYWARHTFATTLKRKGASIEEIQEAMGHADARTTEGYLDSFDIETKRKIANLL